MSGGRIRVMFVIASLDVSGGSERHVVELATSLDDRFETLLVCTKELGRFGQQAVAGGLAAEELGLSSGYDPATFTRLRAVMKEFTPDIVHCTNFNSTAWGRVAGIAAGVPALITAEHSTVRTRGVERWVLPLSNVILGPRTDAVVACGHNQVAALVAERNPASRIVVIDNGVDVDLAPLGPDPATRASLGVPPDALGVAIVAELRPEKDHVTLLAAAARAVEQGADVHVAVVGDGALRQALAEATALLGLDERVHFLGWRDDVPRVLASLDVLALSSVFETAPLSILEGMAAGLPVVTTAVGDAPRVVIDSETGFVVPVGDQVAMGRRFATLAADPELRARMGAAGRLRASDRYSLSAMTGSYEQLFTDVAARHRTAR